MELYLLSILALSELILEVRNCRSSLSAKKTFKPDRLWCNPTFQRPSTSGFLFISYLNQPAILIATT
jgi:hypothetical protein